MEYTVEQFLETKKRLRDAMDLAEAAVTRAKRNLDSAQADHSEFLGAIRRGENTIRKDEQG